MTTLLGRPCTAEDLVAMPDDGIERWIEAGELKERPMSRRTRPHCRTSGVVMTRLNIWLMTQPQPRGEVLGNDAAVRLLRDPETTFGVDVCYCPPELLALQFDNARVVDGVPPLMVEILSPSDTTEEIAAKAAAFLAAGVAHVWTLNPFDGSLTVRKPDGSIRLFHGEQEIDAEPHLPGFRARARELFQL